MNKKYGSIIAAILVGVFLSTLGILFILWSRSISMLILGFYDGLISKNNWYEIFSIVPNDLWELVKTTAKVIDEPLVAVNIAITAFGVLSLITSIYTFLSPYIKKRKLDEVRNVVKETLIKTFAIHHNKTIKEKFFELQQLKDDGIISNQEYENKRSDILNDYK